VTDVQADLKQNVAETSEPAHGNEGVANGKVKPGGAEKPRRKMGHDVVVILESFHAPLSPEEEELFGL
jgi:hypothetical protein